MENTIRRKNSEKDRHSYLLKSKRHGWKLLANQVGCIVFRLINEGANELGGGGGVYFQEISRKVPKDV